MWHFPPPLIWVCLPGPLSPPYSRKAVPSLTFLVYSGRPLICPCSACHPVMRFLQCPANPYFSRWNPKFVRLILLSVTSTKFFGSRRFSAYPTFPSKLRNWAPEALFFFSDWVSPLSRFSPPPAEWVICTPSGFNFEYRPLRCSGGFFKGAFLSSGFCCRILFAFRQTHVCSFLF